MIRISPTALNRFADCPRSYQLSKQYKVLGETPQHFLDGTAVHLELSKPHQELENLTQKGVAYYTQLRQLEDSLHLKVVGRELSEIFQITSGVEMHRIIDVLAYYNEEPLLLDYKTSSKKWGKIFSGKTLTSVKASGFQAVAYLIEPPNNDIFSGEWPNWIFFLVATQTEGEIIRYKKSSKDTQNFFDTVKLLQYCTEENIFPQYKGKACGSGKFPCDFQAMCYKQSGWEDKYTEKDSE